MTTEAQEWARKRNSMLYRLRNAIHTVDSILSSNICPLRSNAIKAVTHLQHLRKDIESIKSYKEYKTRMREKEEQNANRR